MLVNAGHRFSRDPQWHLAVEAVRGSEVSIMPSHCQSRGLSGSLAPPEACILQQVLVHHPLHLLLTSTPLQCEPHAFPLPSASLIYSDGSPLPCTQLWRSTSTPIRKAERNQIFKQAIIKRSFACAPVGALGVLRGDWIISPLSDSNDGSRAVAKQQTGGVLNS